MEAWQPSKLSDEVRLLGGVLKCAVRNSECGMMPFHSAFHTPLSAFDLSSECGGCTRLCEGRRPGSIPGEDTGCFVKPIHRNRSGGVPCVTTISTNRTFFETMSKRRKGFPSETRVKRGVRIVHGDKMLEEKLGRNDLCPCGSGKRFKKCCLKKGCFRRR